MEINNENMTVCNNCGNPVSITATTCPHCGNNELKKTDIICQDYKDKNKDLKKKVGIIGLIFNVVLFFSTSGFGQVISLFFGCFFFTMFGDGIVTEKKGVCPHCNTEITFKANAQNVKCKSCGKESIAKETELIAK